MQNPYILLQEVLNEYFQVSEFIINYKRKTLFYNYIFFSNVKNSNPSLKLSYFEGLNFGQLEATDITSISTSLHTMRARTGEANLQ